MVIEKRAIREDGAFLCVVLYFYCIYFMMRSRAFGEGTCGGCDITAERSGRRSCRRAGRVVRIVLRVSAAY